ncbi:hypothetical protein KFZ70_01005 [Tamlana fucoidanivorans]|uniref:Uncharacterized protein n=1 Tax=Allotamlana fucoidanivorans TaxID=2583814 RepID=A0A5C4SM56_9FLAO|nr:hypothetical protein [Tamlana fucoidanivorans]TNJ44591.1 hypothetical protein FGF67_08065 [Tamlana fucoidanivorans]
MRIFKEEQRFTQSWLLIVIGLSIMIPLIFLTNGLIAKQISLLNYLLISSFIILCCSFIFIFKLNTRIDEIGIHYQFFPIHRNLKTIYWKDIFSAKTRKYNAIKEYGGWGLRGGSLLGGKNIAINVKGNIGLQLTLKNKKRILIGTQKKSEIDRVISRYLNQN